MATKGNDEPIFISFLNPVKSGIYQDLINEDVHQSGNYSAEDFRRDEFINANTKEISSLIDKYIKSKPRKDLADEHFKKLTDPRTRIPGGSKVKKLYQ